MDFQSNVLEWAGARGILLNGKIETQGLKLASEAGEVCDAIAKGDDDNLRLEIGDCAVLLTIIAELAGMDFQECCNAAWEKIRHREGYLNSSGVFVKTGDYIEQETQTAGP